MGGNNWKMYEPCPECGNDEEFLQMYSDLEKVSVDENGEPTVHVPIGDAFCIKYIECVECGERLLETRHS